MTFEEWKAKHDDEIVNVATVFFNYERGVDTRTCYDELEWLLRKAFISGQNHCNCSHTDNSKVIERLEKENTGLKLKLEALDGQTPWKDIKDKSELIKENAELKALLNCNNCYELSEEECEVCAEYSHFKCKRKDQLTKAKEIIKLGLEGIKREFIIDSDGGKPFAKEALKMCNDYCEQAEQFLNKIAR